MVTKTEEQTYLVPEIELTITQAWITLIAYCQECLPYGDLFIEVNNAQPGKKIKEVPSVRFDKPSTSVREGPTYLIKSLNMQIPKPWIDLIQWCQEYFSFGKLGFRIVKAYPTELLQAKQKVDFSKPETIPSGIPLEFDKVI